jgi:hypothetical protein
VASLKSHAKYPDFWGIFYNKIDDDGTTKKLAKTTLYRYTSLYIIKTRSSE